MMKELLLLQKQNEAFQKEDTCLRNMNINYADAISKYINEEDEQYL